MAHWTETLLQACIRVGGGTGFILDHGNGTRVVVTAAHVVGSNKTVRASWQNGQAEFSVLHADTNLDVAVLSDNGALDSRTALHIADHPPSVGTPIAFAGFPAGWDGKSPVLQRGWVAAEDREEIWFDGNANPGNSGGPVISHDLDAPRVVGVVLGRAGNVDQSLRQFSAAIDKIHSQATVFKFPMTLGTRDVIGDILRLTAGGLKDMAGLMDRHFRTGLVRASGSSRLRQALGI